MPRQVLLANVGRDRLWVEAVESHIGGWFWNAAAQSRLRPVATPGVRLRAPREREGAVDVQRDRRGAADAGDRRLDDTRGASRGGCRTRGARPGGAGRSRSSIAELVPADDRPAREGDTVVVDLAGADGEGQSDTVVELGTGRLVAEIERHRRRERRGPANGALRAPGRLRDHGRGDRQARQREGAPAADDDLARSASEFDTLADLRADIEGRVLAAVEEQIDSAFRAAAVDELVRASNVQGAGPLVESRARELLNGFVRSLANRGVSPEAYFEATGQSPELLTAQIRAEASQSVARELALEAVAEKVGIVVSDDEVKDLIREQTAASGDDREA